MQQPHPGEPELTFEPPRRVMQVCTSFRPGFGFEDPHVYPPAGAG